MSMMVISGLACLAVPGCAPDKPEESAEADAESLAQTGRDLMMGRGGLAPDAAKARALFEKAARKGSGAAYFYWGLLANEPGTRADVEEACGLFAQSAALNHPEGLRAYGECRFNGVDGTARDPGAAAELFRQSISRGGVQAYASLARLYTSGEGVPKDPAEAARLMQKFREAN